MKRVANEFPAEVSLGAGDKVPVIIEYEGYEDDYSGRELCVWLHYVSPWQSWAYSVSEALKGRVDIFEALTDEEKQNVYREIAADVQSHQEDR